MAGTQKCDEIAFGLLTSLSITLLYINVRAEIKTQRLIYIKICRREYQYSVETAQY